MREGSKRGELVNRMNRGTLKVNEMIPECALTSGLRSLHWGLLGQVLVLSDYMEEQHAQWPCREPGP